MTRDQLFAELCPAGAEIVLRADMPVLQPLGKWLRDVMDPRGELVIHPEVDAVPEEMPEDRLIIEGDTTVFGVPAIEGDTTVLGVPAIEGDTTVLGVPAKVKATFVFAAGQLDHLYLLFRMSPNWRLMQSFTDLPNYAGGSAFFESFHFDSALLIVSARAPAITDAKFGLHQELFENGLNLFAVNLLKPLRLNSFGLGHFPAGAAVASQPPDLVKAVIMRHTGAPSIRIVCWWQPRGEMKVGQAVVKRMGLGFSSGVAAAAEASPDCLWLWDLQLHADTPPFVLVATVPEDEMQSPTYSVVFESARFLKSGAGALAALTDGHDPSDSLPFPASDAPHLNLATLTFQPGSWVGASFVLMDSETGKPYEWEAIADVLTVEDVRLSLQMTLKPSVSIEVGVLGIADIKGYQYEVDVVPGHRVRGELVKPHELEIEAFLASLLGHPIDFPNLQLKLLAAKYANNLKSKTVSYGVTVGGHIDLLGNGTLLLESVGFEVERVDGKPTRKHLKGTVSLVGTAIRLEADYLKGDGWTFEGSARPDLEIPIDEMAEDLAHRAGLAFPPEMPEVTLSEFGLRFGGKRKLFRIWGRAKWRPPEGAALPWFSGEVDTVVDIASSVNPQTATRETEIDLQWLHTNGGHTFQATANHRHDGNSFFISWVGGADKATLGFHALHDLLHLGEVFSLPDGEGWKIFEFSRLLVGYQSNPRLVQLLAKSTLGAGELVFDATFASDSRAISATWQGNDEADSVGIDDLLTSVGLPPQFSLLGSIGKDIFEFHELSFRYVGGTKPTLQFVGKAGHAFYKDVFLVMLKVAGNWGFVTGITFKERSHLDDIPGIGNIPGLDAVSRLFAIEPVFLLYSSTAADNFVPPISDVGASSGFARAPRGQSRVVTTKALAGATVSSRGAYRLTQGATVAARILFEESDNAALTHVARLIKLKELDARITFGDGFDVLALLPGEIEIPTGMKLSNAFFGLRLIGTDTTFQIGGTTRFNLFGETRELEMRLMVNEEAAEASVHFENFLMPPVCGLPGVRFTDDFYLEMGVQFVPEGLDMGFMGGFYIGDGATRSTGTVVVVLEMIEEIPNPLYVQFSISSLSIWSMFEAKTGLGARLADAESLLKVADQSGASDAIGASEATHDAEHALEFLRHQYKNLQSVLDVVALNDVSFHWSDSVVILPDGTTAMPGVGFRGWLNLFGWHAFAAFEFSACSPTRLTAHLEMAPCNLHHIVSITGDGKGVLKSEAQGMTEAWQKWQAAGKAKDPGLLKPQAGADYVVQPGGPVLIVSSQHAPFLHANLHVAILDLLHLDVTANLDAHGLAFELTSGVGDMIGLTLGCVLNQKDGFRFEAYGQFRLHLDADLSFELPLIGRIPIALNAGLDAEIHLIVTDHASEFFKLTIDGSFEFEGADLTLPTLTLTVPLPSLGDLPKKIIAHIEHTAVEIFGDLFGELGDLAGKAIEAVGEAAEAVGQEVEKIGEEAVKDAKLIVESVEHAVDAVEEDVEKAAKAIAAGADAIASAVTEELDALEKQAEAIEEALGEDARLALDAAEHAVEAIGEAVSAEVSAIEHKVADIANQAAHEIAEIGEEVARDVKEVLDVAEHVADELVDVANDVAKGVEHAAEAVFDEAKDIANSIEHGLEGAAKGVAHGFRDVGAAVVSIY